MSSLEMHQKTPSYDTDSDEENDTFNHGSVSFTENPFAKSRPQSLSAPPQTQSNSFQLNRLPQTKTNFKATKASSPTPPKPQAKKRTTTLSSREQFEDAGDYLSDQASGLFLRCLERADSLPWWMQFWKRENWSVLMFFNSLTCCIASFIAFKLGMEDGKNVNRMFTEMGFLSFLGSGIMCTLAIMFKYMDQIAEDMIENMDPNTNCRDMMINTFTNLSLVSALLFTVLVAMLYTDFDFNSIDDFISNSEIGKDFWQAATFFNIYVAMVYTIAATLCAVVLIIYITPLSSESAVDFMEMNGWSSGLCFEFTVGGIIWMFFAICCANRVIYGASAFIVSAVAPTIVFFILGFVWRQASKFSVPDSKRHRSVSNLKDKRVGKKKK
ncbi:hypothetical protein ScalyP_jg10611 [Parmales sp. scaly parma]|nr:hypothetical protein ScalyP_jg10611 [Parmales sp. scaly parma]